MAPKRKRASGESFTGTTPKSHKKSRVRSPSPEASDSEPSTQESYYEAVEILEEQGQKYLIKWAGIDQATNQPFEPTWEPKSFATKALRDEWKAKKSEGAEPPKKNKGGRSRKHPLSEPAEATNATESPVPKRKPRRPRKNPLPETAEEGETVEVSPKRPSKPTESEEASKSASVLEHSNTASTPAEATPIKPKRGRPKKNSERISPTKQSTTVPAVQAGPSKKRGRPRKNPLPIATEPGAVNVSSPAQPEESSELSTPPETNTVSSPVVDLGATQEELDPYSSFDLPNQEHAVQILQHPSFDRDAYVQFSQSPSFLRQRQVEIEPPSSDVRSTQPPIQSDASSPVLPKGKTDVTFKGPGVVPDSQSLPGSSSYVPSTQSKGTIGGTFVPTQDLLSSVSKEKSTLELVSTTEHVAGSGFDQAPAIESDPIKDPSSPVVQKEVETPLPEVASSTQSISSASSPPPSTADSPNKTQSQSQTRSGERGDKLSSQQGQKAEEGPERSPEQGLYHPANEEDRQTGPVQEQVQSHKEQSTVNVSATTQSDSQPAQRTAPPTGSLIEDSGSSLNEPTVSDLLLVVQIDNIEDTSVADVQALDGSIDRSEVRADIQNQEETVSDAPSLAEKPTLEEVFATSHAAPGATREHITESQAYTRSVSPTKTVHPSIEQDIFAPREESSSPIPAIPRRSSQAFLDNTLWDSTLSAPRQPQIIKMSSQELPLSQRKPVAVLADDVLRLGGSNVAWGAEHQSEVPPSLTVNPGELLRNQLDSFTMITEEQILNGESRPEVDDDDSAMEVDSGEQDTVPLKAKEYIIPIGMESIQRDTYRSTLAKSSDLITEFLSGNPKDWPAQSPYEEGIRPLIHQLHDIELHMDLITKDTDTPSQTNSTPDHLANWYSSQHQSFKILRSLIEKLRDTEVHIVLVSKPGLMMHFLEIFCQGINVEYTRQDRPQFSAEPESDGLHVSIVSSSGEGSDHSLNKPPDIMFLLDYGVDIEKDNIRELRIHDVSQEPPYERTLCPIVSFVSVNSVSHVERCIPVDHKLSPTNWLRVVLSGTCMLRGDVPKNAEGEGYINPEMAANKLTAYLKTNGSKWTIPSLELSQRVYEIMDSYGLLNDLEITSSVLVSTQETTVSHKRPASQSDIMAQNTKRFRPTPQPDAVADSDAPKADEIVDPNHVSTSRVTDTVANASQQSQENTALRQTLRERDQLLRNYSIALQKSQNQTSDLRSQLAVSNKTNITTTELAANRLRRIEAQDATIISTREERDKFKAGMEEMSQIATKSDNALAAEVASLKLQNDELRTGKEKADKAKAAAESNFEFTREQYQTASNLATEYKSRNAELEAEIARLRPLAEGELTRLKEMDIAERTDKYKSEIEKLRVEKESYRRLLNKKEDEIRVLNQNQVRSMSTRGSSVPLQRSPRPAAVGPRATGSRAGSPAKVGSRVGVLRQE